MSDAHGVARDQLRAFVERIERLEEEKKIIADDIKDVFGEAKSMGFDTKILKKVIALRKKDEQERTEEELILDTYLQALGMIPQIELFDDEEAPVAKRQPAMALQSPRKAAEAVSERTVTQDKAFSSDLVDVITTEAEAGVSGQPEMIPVLTGQFPGVNVSGPEKAGVTGGESAAAHSPSDDDAIAAVKGKARLANVADVEPSSSAPIAPAAHGEAEAPSAASVSLDDGSSAAANTGGGHVDDVKHAATQNADGLVEHIPSTTFILRPNCLRPDSCAGHGSNHCHSCKAAMRERELA